MKAFMDQDFLLQTKTAKHLYHDYARKMPLFDYHCHLSPKDIYEDRRFSDMAEVWLGGKTPDGGYFGDHYKWRILRSNGADEAYIRAEAEPYERFLEFTKALEMAIGNPMYHWCHLELQQFFGITEPLTEESAPRIWEHCNNLLQNDPGMSARGLIAKANVRFIGTTDDPVDDLCWHEKIAADPTIDFLVCPSFRPDRALHIQKADFCDYINQLAACVGKSSLDTVDDVCEALLQRLAYFHERGCRASDHSLPYIPFCACTAQQANAVYQKTLRGEAVTQEESDCYQTFLLLALGKAYQKYGIVMQLHYSVVRNLNARIFRQMGVDAGIDAIAPNTCAANIAALLSALDEDNACPKTILYSLNPADNAQLGTIIGCFQDSSLPGKIQQGSAWWFNDNKTGMQEQMTSLANLGLLGNFVGMLTDSRSFLSYARHDYFRRTLCNLVGDWVENGEYPNHEASLQKIIEGVSYRNAARYFNAE